MKRIPIKKFLLVLLGVWLTGISGCGENQVKVLITPRTATVPKGAPQQFTVEVIDTQDIAVTWSIDNDTTPPSKGIIDTNGLYHPPDNLPNPNTVTIRVTSNADPSISDTATVTLTTGEVLSFGTNQRVTDSTNTATSTISSGQHSIQVNQYTPNTPAGNTLIATTIYTVWNDNRNTNNDIFFDKKVIDPAGISVDFVNDVQVNGVTTGEQTEPSLALNATTAIPPVVRLYTAWTDTSNGNNDIFMATSLDGGATWNASTQVNDPTNESFSQIQPSIVVDSGGGNIYIAWTDNRNGDNDIFFARGSVNLTTGAVTITHPCGVGMTTDCRINDDTIANGFSQSQPSLAFHNGVLYAAWTDDRNGNSDIFLARSTDGGTTWSQNVKVNDDTNTSFTQTSPSIAVTTVNNIETIYIAWQDDRNGTNDIYFAKGTVGAGGVITIDHPCGPTTTTTTTTTTTSTTTTTVPGSTTSTTATTTTTTTSTTTTTLPEDCRVNDDTAALGWPDTANQIGPSLTVDKFGNIYISWQDNRNGSNDIFFAKSMDGGLSYGQNSQVNDHSPFAAAAASQTTPSLAVDDQGRSYIIWTDGRNAVGTGSDVFFAVGE